MLLVRPEVAMRVRVFVDRVDSCGFGGTAPARAWYPRIRGDLDA